MLGTSPSGGPLGFNFIYDFFLLTCYVIHINVYEQNFRWHGLNEQEDAFGYSFNQDKYYYFCLFTQWIVKFGGPWYFSLPQIERFIYGRKVRTFLFQILFNFTLNRYKLFLRKDGFLNSLLITLSMISNGSITYSNATLTILLFLLIVTWKLKIVHIYQNCSYGLLSTWQGSELGALLLPNTYDHLVLSKIDPKCRNRIFNFGFACNIHNQVYYFVFQK